MPRVSITLANKNDLQMLLVTVLSAVEELSNIDGEIIVVDNSDLEYKECVEFLLSGQIRDGMVRLIHQEESSGAAAMERAAQESLGEYLFYTDSHTMIGHGTIAACLDFYDRHKGEPIAFVHPYLQWAHNSKSARKSSFRLHRNNLGSWGKQIQVECKIPWKGMPHMVPKEVYRAIGGYGCLAEHYVGWGGLIPYLGIKPWLFGYENWAIPTGVSYHFGEYPAVCRDHIKYRLYAGNGRYQPGTSHAVSAYVFGGEQFLQEQFNPAKMYRYFADYKQALSLAKKIGEEDRKWIQENQKISIYELLENPPWGKDF